MVRFVHVLVWALLASLVACTQQGDDVIRFGLAAAPANLDPRFATDATSARINRLLYRRLVDFDDRVRPVPSLATWTEVTSQHYRFHLGAAGREFHDGSRLTADDVVATYRSILDPSTGSPHRGTLSIIERVEPVDADTVDFFLTRSDPLFPGYLVIGIAPASRLGVPAGLHQQPLGSGAFQLQGWPDPGRLLLKRRADGQVVEFVHVKDPTVRVLKLMRGELDLVQNDLPAELVNYLAKQPGLSVDRRRGSNFSYIGFNLDRGVTTDIRVRQAIAHAIDRDEVIRYVLGEGAQPASALLPPDHWAGASLPLLRHDPELARERLAAAGYDAVTPLELKYKTSADPLRLRIATVFQQQLSRVGIKVDVQSYDWGTFYGDIKAGRFEMYSLAWVGIKTPDIFRYAFHSASLPPEGANRGRLADAGIDRLIEEAERGKDLQQQATRYRSLQGRLLELLPYVPLWYEDHVVISRGDIADYRLAADGNYDGLESVTRTPSVQPANGAPGL